MIGKAESIESRDDPAVRLKARIAALRGRIEPANAQDGVSLGLPRIEAHLPRGALARGVLHEVAPQDYRATPAALGFLAALAVCLLGASESVVLWPCLRFEDRRFGALYGPGLKRLGLDPERLVLARCASARDLLWTMEEGARQTGLGAVIGARPPKMTLTQSRRLQLAARASGTPVLLLREAADESPSAAVTRWRIAPRPASRDRLGYLASPRWVVTLERARGGRTGTWAVEWDYDAHCFRPSSVLADRAFPQSEERGVEALFA